MQIRVFKILLSNPEPIQSELNSFLRGHRILEVKSYFVENDGQAYWAFLVQYLDGHSAHQPGKGKIDYKEILSDEDFKAFSRLREIRKVLAGEDGVPAYMVFTDEELAEIVRNKCSDGSELSKISGIGEKKIEKYGIRLLTRFVNTQ